MSIPTSSIWHVVICRKDVEELIKQVELTKFCSITVTRIWAEIPSTNYYIYMRCTKKAKEKPKITRFLNLHTDFSSHIQVHWSNT